MDAPAAVHVDGVSTPAHEPKTDTGGKLRKNRNEVAKLVPQQRTTGGSSGSDGQTCEGVSPLLGMAESCPPTDSRVQTAGFKEENSGGCQLRRPTMTHRTIQVGVN